MLKRLLAFMVVLALGIIPASPQVLWLRTPTASGPAIGNGYDFVNGQLFIASSATMNITGPLSVAVWVKTTALTSSNSTVFFSNYHSGAGGYGIWDTGYGSGAISFMAKDFPIQYFTRPFSADNCANAGEACVRRSLINDGNWHHLCGVTGTTSTSLYVDGTLRDQNPVAQVATAVGSNDWWLLGQTKGSGQLVIRDVRLYSRALSNVDCANLWKYGLQNKTPNSGPLQTALNGWWTLNGDTLDHSGNANNATTDQTPPTISITAPTAGTVSGTVSLQASTSDAVAVNQVAWSVDGSSVGSSTAGAPWTVSWNSTNYVDGSHTITAVATNAAGINSSTASVTVTSSNGVVARNYYFDPVAGSDSNACTSSTAPCQTIAKLNAQTYHGGDVINLKAGTLAAGSNFNLTGSNQIFLAGPGVSGHSQNVFPGGAGAPVTITSYGGGACNTIATTTAGCATITLDPAATAMQAVVIYNLPNITVQNLLIINNGNTAALGFQASTGIYVNVNQGVNYGVVIQNNLVQDFANLIYQTQSAAVWSSANQIDSTIQNNKLCGSTSTTTVDNAIWLQYGWNSAHILGNYICNIAGKPLSTTGGYYKGGTGNGILFTNWAGVKNGSSANPSVVEYNLANSGDNNVNTCGSGYAYWTDVVQGVTFQFNEAMNWQVASGSGGCDGGAFDIDQSSTNVLMQYNYSHKNGGTVGPAFNLFNQLLAGANAWNHNTVRYNVSENDGAGVGLISAQTGMATAVYNNTFYQSATTGGVCFVMGNGGNYDLVYANNVCHNTNTLSHVMIYSPNSTPPAPPTSAVFTHNAYYTAAGSFAAVDGSSSQCVTHNNCNTLADLQAAYGYETGSIQVSSPTGLGLTNPGGGGTCQAGTSIPTGPQPCPNAYVATTGSVLIGSGIDLTQTPYSLNVGTRDYYGTSIPNGHGTGYNIGADGAFH